MESSLRGAEAAEAWAEWDRRNVAVEGEGVTLPREDLPTYDRDRLAAIRADGTVIEGVATGDELGEDEATVVDVALAPCGDPYVLDADGRLYRYDPARGAAERLACVWRATGDPRALCVTGDTIYVAGGDPAAVQAISRYATQMRWIAREGVDDPIALARSGGEAYLLDGASTQGSASVEHVCPDSTVEHVVVGLMAPLDLAAGPGGRLWILDALVGADPGEDDETVVRRFAADDLEPGSPTDATDSVLVAPGAFRIASTGEPVVPTALAVGAAGEFLVGVASGGGGRLALLRYRPTEGGFERQPAFEAGARALAAPDGADEPRAYAVDDDPGRLHVLDGGYRVRTGADGDTAGRARMRFAAAEEDVEWHRVHLERTLGGPETEVQVRYAATDAPDPEPATGDGWDAPGLETLSGLGTTYADRLRAWGIADLADLAAYDPVAVQSIVSVEELDVSESTATDWRDAAASLLAGGESGGADVEAVGGIGPTYGARLRAGGIPDLAGLADAAPAAVVRIASAGTLDVSLSHAETWVQAARDRRPEPPDYDALDWTAITPASPRDALFEGAVGRYLWIEVELVGTPTDAPAVDALSVEFPRETYLEDLPAIYREDESSAAFLERYLSLFERVFADVEAATEALTSYLDPDGIPADPGHLAWLGEFLAVDVDGAWPTAAAREFIDRAPELYRMRGTRQGLLTAASIYLDHVTVPTRDWDRAREHEDARLDRLVEEGLLAAEEAEAARAAHERLAARELAPAVTFLSWADLACSPASGAREFYERLVGCPEGFLVLVHPRVGEAHVRALSKIVASQEPAHVSARTVGLESRVQLAGDCPGDTDAELGYHTYLGVNTALAEREFALEEAGLGEETVVGSHEPDGQLGLGARLGGDAHLS